MNVNDPKSDEKEKADLATLVKQRGILKGRLTKFNDYILTTKGQKEIASVKYKELELKMNKLQSLLNDFDALQDKIDILHSDSNEQVKERDTIENQFMHLISSCQEILDQRPATQGPTDNFSSCHSASGMNAIKLPTIKLPTFDGNYLNWLEFKDTFESVINNNEGIPPINKFHYLRSSLEGSASVVIKSIEFSAKNYTVAWDLLCQRYNNINILINNHLKALFNIEPLRMESFKALRFIVDNVSKHLRALETLGQPTDKWDTLIIFMISLKLDINSNGRWEEFKCNLGNLPSLNDFYSFLRGRADVLETTYSNKTAESRQKPTGQSKSLVLSNDKKSDKKSYKSCLVCNNEHFLHECPTFKGMCVEDRFNEVSKLKLCKNCLRSGHNAHQCKLKGLCFSCKRKHNTLIHKNDPSCEEPQQPTTSSLPVSLTLASSSGQVLLCTALVKIIVNSKTYTARVMCDSGSQSSFITEKSKQRLGLKTDDSSSINISGINNCGFKINKSCTIQIQSRVNSYNFKVKCLVVPRITGVLPNAIINKGCLKLPSNIELADPTFFFPAEVDILLGADVYYDLIGSNIIRLGSKKPVLQESKLGWLVGGPILNSQSNNKINCNFSQEIKDSLEKFWSIDDLPQTKTLSVEEQLCENHFANTFNRLPNGRFSVQMPLKESPEKALGDSYFIAKKCLESLERKFIKFPSLKTSYKECIEEYARLGHLTKIKPPEFGYYMPHHAVIREKSETTKIRVVFNASSKTYKGKSLNDIQMVGPVVQSDLISILLRFREHKYILTGDIEKMYRQVEIAHQQRHLQLILWREEKHHPIDVLQLNTVTFGTASGPFLSFRCLVQLAKECQDETIARVIQNDFYADDLNTGCNTVNGLKYIYENVKRVLESACFPLRKFRTNCPDLFDHEYNSHDAMEFCKESSVLGLKWSPSTDVLQFSTNLEASSVVTKRSVISTASKVFDPLGLVSPCIIVAKILLQTLWSSKLDWDDEVPEEFCKNWLSLTKEFAIMSLITIPRRALAENPNNVELHCFVDASQHAYAACIYLRSENTNVGITVKLLCSKARVAPIAPTTIPRLELCATLLGARLCSKVLQSLRSNVIRKYLWTDSTVVLGWLKTPTRDLKVFVCNRVNEIHELTNGFSFNHVPTDMNPADMASRGVSPKRLQSSTLWWDGPAFLSQDKPNWPQLTHSLSHTNLPEIKNTSHCHIATTNNVIQIERFSNLTKLKRVYGYVFRFINNCKKSNLKLTGPLQVDELNKSLLTLVKHSQRNSFNEEYNAIKNNKAVNRKSKLLSLNCFIDSEDLLRVGGRIKNSDFDFDKKHPLILDAKHHLTILLFRHEHERLFHAGPQHLLASIREKFWPIGGRCLARGTTKQCITCIRLRGHTLQPLMGHIPAQRSYSSFPFYSCGVDMAGPFMISSRKGKGNRISKCYLCLFICLASKAIHLELVSDMSAEAFILSLRRFVSRRGKPHSIFCDNGSNFKGANNEINRIIRSSRAQVTDFASNEGFRFIHSPAYSPHFGGIWEAGVKSAKYHLKRVAGNASLTFEELTTLFVQIEAILNSRPLTPLSSDPIDPSPLTPGHFLIGRPVSAVPSLPITAKRPNRYQLIEQLRQHFWDRWRREFVAELQQRTKWKTRQRELQVGDLVILKEDNLPPLQWRLARIVKLFPGTDGISRVADVLTPKGTIRRAINKMCIIPKVEDNEEPFNHNQEPEATKDETN